MKLNLGCGRYPLEGYINTDIVKLDGVDEVMDLNQLPYKYETDSCDEIVLNSVLEHLDNPHAVLKELLRMLKPGCKLNVIVPHFTTTKAFSDPTHKNFYGLDTFKYYLKGDPMNYYFDFGFSEVKVKLHFAKKFQVWNHLIEWIANKSSYIYEHSALRAFPALHLEVTLVK